MLFRRNKDNNTSERALRGPVIGRKNYYGSGSEVSAELASHAWTITATAHQAGLNPLTYLSAYLNTSAHHGATAWAHHPPTPHTTKPDTTGNSTTSQDTPAHTGPAP